MNKEEEAINMIKSQKENVDECLIAMENPENYVGEDVEKEYLGWQKNAEIILNLIQKQEKIIDMAMELISRKVGSRIEICPDMNCCEETVGKRTCKQCAKEYFKKEVEKECEK